MANTPRERDPAYLFPEFREKLEWVLDQIQKATKHDWKFTYGYRSAEQQKQLYSIGRRGIPGEKPVTWITQPTWHGAGLAADCYPTVKDVNAVPNLWYQDLLRLGKQVGLSNPAWSKGDFGHLQLGVWGDPTSMARRLKALQWLRQGRPALATSGAVPDPPKVAEVPIYVNTELIPDADGFVDPDGHLWVWVRPVAEALDWTVWKTGIGFRTSVELLRDPAEEGGKSRTIRLDMWKRALPGDPQSRGFVRVTGERGLIQCPVRVEWYGKERGCYLTDDEPPAVRHAG